VFTDRLCEFFVLLLLCSVGSCLMEGVPNPDHDSSIDDNVENNLPGEIFTADDQCYVAGSPAACDSVI